MRFVAFFRNIYLGRPGNPTTAELVAAFDDAGAQRTRSFLATGNILFDAANKPNAFTINSKVSSALKSLCNFSEPAFIRTVPYLTNLVTQNPFGIAPTDNVYERCVSFLPEGRLPPLPKLPIASSRQDVEIFLATDSEVFSITRMIGGKSGNAGSLLDRLKVTPTTVRNWNTIERILKANQVEPE